MKSKKRLGKTLEDISHLFLSDRAPVSAENPTAPDRKAFSGLGIPITRTWLAVSLISEIPSAFFAGNLAIQLARSGKRILAVETAPLPSLDEILGTVHIQPSLNHLLDQSDKKVTVEGPLDMKVLSFRLCLEELKKFPVEEQEILFQILSKEEQSSDLTLVHAVYSEDPTFEALLRTAQGVMLIASPRMETVSETYRVCKHLYYFQPSLRLSLMMYGGQDGESVIAWKEKLTGAVGQFLGKSLEWHGMIPADPNIERSLSAKIPLTLLDQSSVASSCFAKSAGLLQAGVRIEKNGSVGEFLFFNRLQHTFNETGDP